MPSMDGKVAVITGAQRGVGFGIAEEFIANGATVVITDIDQQGIDEAVAKLGLRSSAIKADVTSLADMEAAYRQVIERHGHLDAVVANAGVGDSAPLGSITEKQFDFIFGVNAKGVLFTVQAALSLLPAGGTAVIIGSTASIQAGRGMSLYSGSKAAIRAFVRSWIQEIKGTGVRITIVDQRNHHLFQAQVTRMGEGNPSGRLADPREMGKAAVFLSSDASSYITGVELFVDGGLAQTG